MRPDIAASAEPSDPALRSSLATRPTLRNVHLRARTLLTIAAVALTVLLLSWSTGAARTTPVAAGFAGFGFGQPRPAARGNGDGRPAPARGSAAPGAASESLDLSQVAASLQVTSQTLQAELAAGETLTQAIEAHGATVEQVADAVLASVRARLDQQVASGQLSQDQEQQMLAGSRSRLINQIKTYSNTTLPPGSSGPGH